MIGSDPIAALCYQTISMMTLVVLSMSFLHGWISHSGWYRAAMGVVLGGSAIIGMMAPMNMQSGAILDARTLMIGISGAYFGPWAAIISTGMAATARIMQGNLGLFSGLSAICLSGLSGWIWGTFIRPRKYNRVASSSVLGLMLCSSIIGSIVFIPQEWRSDFLALMTVPLCAMNIFGSVLFSCLIRRENARQRAVTLLHKAAFTDALTGALNRRAFVTLYEQQVQQQLPLALLYVDIDHFKSINDRYGHQIGDIALQNLVTTLQVSLPDAAQVARLGGEEFCISLPQHTAEQANDLSQNLVETVAQSQLCTQIPDLHCTISIGVAHSNDEIEFDTLLSHADQRLYSAKAAGRNRSIGTDHHLTPSPNEKHAS